MDSHSCRDGTIAVYRPTLALSGPPLGFMVGWNLFWGLLIGAVAMWGAQLDGAGWAYGIAGADRIFRRHHPGHLRTRQIFRGMTAFSPSR